MKFLDRYGLMKSGNEDKKALSLMDLGTLKRVSRICLEYFGFYSEPFCPYKNGRDCIIMNEDEILPEGFHRNQPIRWNTEVWEDSIPRYNGIPSIKEIRKSLRSLSVEEKWKRHIIRRMK